MHFCFRFLAHCVIASMFGHQLIGFSRLHSFSVLGFVNSIVFLYFSASLLIEHASWRKATDRTFKLLSGKVGSLDCDEMFLFFLRMDLELVNLRSTE